ncbi:MAG: hypothetical protein IJD04_08910 [Desulfovibrionaceae bacterium]|nr:hypothetical protein [Desulfovibrionaceae bacterium]
MRLVKLCVAPPETSRLPEPTVRRLIIAPSGANRTEHAMTDSKTTDPLKRPAWARHLDDSVWQSYPKIKNGKVVSEGGRSSEQEATSDIASDTSVQSGFSEATIQEDINSATPAAHESCTDAQGQGKDESTENKGHVQPDISGPAEAETSGYAFQMPSKEELEAVIVKSAPAMNESEVSPVQSEATEAGQDDATPENNSKELLPGSEDTTGGESTPAAKAEGESGLDDAARARPRKSRFSFTRKERRPEDAAASKRAAVDAGSAKTANTAASELTSEAFSAVSKSDAADANRPSHAGRRGKVAPDPERPVRGYGVLTWLPLLTLTVLLMIHVASFIYSYAGETIMEDTRQITLAENLNAADNLFVPTLDGRPAAGISPGQYWFLGTVFKLSPFNSALDLHLAGALAALLFLWGGYLLGKSALPNNKGANFGAGLVILSSVVFLGGAWFFRPEILAIGLLSLAQAALFRGLQKPERAFLWLVPGMILAGLSILCGGSIMAIGLFVPLMIYLLLTGNINRFAAKDMLAGLVALALVIGLWFAGACVNAGLDTALSCLAAFSPIAGDYSTQLSASELAVFAMIMLLPWATLPLLLIDRLLFKIGKIRAALSTPKGQGILYLTAVMIAALLIICADIYDGNVHLALGLTLLPPLAALSARAVLNLSRSRARAFIIITALIFASLTALLSLKAGGFGGRVLPWELSLWAIVPLIGTAAFCTLFLARAAQVSAGRTQLLVYAICWLLMAQVFLFAAMPTVKTYLNFNEFQSILADKTRQESWTPVYLNTPAWAADYSLPGVQTATSWATVADLAQSGPVLAVMPEVDWQNLDKKEYPFKKLDDEVLLLSNYVLAQSGPARLLSTPTSEGTEKEAVISDAAAPLPLNGEQNATEEAAGDVTAAAPDTPVAVDAVDAAVSEIEANATADAAADSAPILNATDIMSPSEAEGLADGTDSENADAATPDAANQTVTPAEPVVPAGESLPDALPDTPSAAGQTPDEVSASAPDKEQQVQSSEQPATQPAEQSQAQPVSPGAAAAPSATETQPEAAASEDMEEISVAPDSDASTPADSAAETEPAADDAPAPDGGIARQVEETIVTSYIPPVTPQINLIYGVIPGMPEVNIILRYQQVRTLPQEQ